MYVELIKLKKKELNWFNVRWHRKYLKLKEIGLLIINTFKIFKSQIAYREK